MTNDKNDYEYTGDQDNTIDWNFTGGNENRGNEGEPYVNLTGEGDISSVGDQDSDEANIDGELDEAESDKAAEWRDKYTRLVAEYDNYRKRTNKEKIDLINAGGEDVVRSLLEVLDDMDRALDAIAKTDDIESVKQGVSLIDNKLRGVLKSHGLAEVEAMGGELDTDVHEAIARIEAKEEAQKGRIMDVVQKGYRLRDRIIRHAKVVVGQ